MFDKSVLARLALSMKSGYMREVKRMSFGVRSSAFARDMTRTCLSKPDTSFRCRTTKAALSFKTSI